MTTDNALPTEGDPRLPTDAQTIVDPGTDHHGFGDQHDDDGPAIDQYLQAAPDTPLPDRYISYGVGTIPKTTRVLTRVIDMGNYDIGQSVLLWPADDNRQYLHIETALDAGTEVPFAWASEHLTPLSAAPLRHSVDMDAHTGAVYVCKTQAGATVISSWVVTV